MAKIRKELEKLPTLRSFDLIDLKKVNKDFFKFVKETGVLLYDGRRLKTKA
jgi:hypothetical protein